MDNGSAVGLTYRPLSSDERENMYLVKEKGQEFLDFLDTLGRSPEMGQAKIRLEEAVMWAVKHITRERR
jgi:hypothetical protein